MDMQRIFKDERRGVRPKSPVPQGLLQWRMGAGPPRRCEPRAMRPESMGHRASARA
jgi:hypothetical protein